MLNKSNTCSLIQKWKRYLKMYFCLFQDFQEKIVQEKPILSDQSDLTDLGMEPDLRLPKVRCNMNIKLGFASRFSLFLILNVNRFYKVRELEVFN